MSIKRFVDRGMFAALIDDLGYKLCEDCVPGFWDIVAEYFTTY